MKKIRIKKCPTGGTVSELGYSDNSPYRNAKSLNIQGNNITMQNTGKNLQLIPMDEYGNMLDAIDAPAYSGEYNFPDAKSVLEIPNYQAGGQGDRPVRKVVKYTKPMEIFETFGQGTPNEATIKRIFQLKSAGIVDDNELKSLLQDVSIPKYNQLRKELGIDKKTKKELEQLNKEFDDYRLNSANQVESQRVLSAQEKANIYKQEQLKKQQYAKDVETAILNKERGQKSAETRKSNKRNERFLQPAPVEPKPILTSQKDVPQNLTTAYPSNKILVDETGKIIEEPIDVMDEVLKRKKNNFTTARQRASEETSFLNKVKGNLGKIANTGSKALKGLNYITDPVTALAEEAYEVGANVLGKATPYLRGLGTVATLPLTVSGDSNPKGKKQSKPIDYNTWMNLKKRGYNMESIPIIQESIPKTTSNFVKKEVNSNLPLFPGTIRSDDYEQILENLVNKKPLSMDVLNVKQGAITDKTDLKTPFATKNPVLRSNSKLPLYTGQPIDLATSQYDGNDLALQNALLDKPEDVIDEGTYSNPRTLNTGQEQMYQDLIKDKNPELNSIPSDKTLGNLGEIIKKGFKGLKIDTGINEQLFANARARLRAKELQFPMYQQVNMQEPAFAEESERPYVNQIQESYNTAVQNINPNSTTGQAMVAQLQANASNQTNDVLGQVFSRNLQRRTDYFNNLSSMRNQEQLTNQQLKQQYVQGVQGTIANRDSILNNLDEDLANKLSAQKQFLNNTKLGLWMAGTPSDAYKINDDSIELDYSQVPMDFNVKTKQQSTTTEGTGKVRVFKDTNGDIITYDPVTKKTTRTPKSQQYL